MSKNQVSPRQLERLFVFLGQHQNLALGQVRGKEGSALSKKLWSQCAAILNSDFRGAQKSAQEWKKYYNQYKSRTKAKLQRIKQGLTKTSGGPAEVINLWPLEERLITLLGECNSPVPVKPLDVLTFNPASEDSNNGGGETGGGGHDDGGGDMQDEEMHNKTGLLSGKQADLESEEVDRKRKRPLRENKEKILKHRHHRRSPSPKVNKDFEAAGQWLAAMEQSRVEVDRELVQAIHRHATVMEDLSGAVNRFVDLYELKLQPSGRSKRHRNASSSSSSSSSKNDT